MYNIIPFYKKTNCYEIACMMFENCNLKCKFCFENHINKTIDTDYIRNIPDIIDKHFTHEYEKYKDQIQTVYIMLWGGEVFYDALSDEVFDSYYDFVDKTNELFATKFSTVKVQFSWLTNGVFKRIDRVLDIVMYSKGIINFSYDPVNRFSTERQRDLMANNAKLFKSFCGDKVSITLTKDSIKGFIEKDYLLKVFNDLGYNLDVNYYIANPNWKDLLATDDEIASFFIWAINNKLYNMKVLEKIFRSYLGQRQSPYCNCLWCSQITHGEWSIDCAKCSSVLPASDFYGRYVDEMTEENTNQIKASLGIMKRGCLYCKYYNICQYPCWISIVFHGFKSENCFYKQIYEYLDNHKECVEDFKEWVEKNGKQFWV